MSWQTHAKCKGKTHLFFAAPNERPSKRDARENEAVALCKVCPVAQQCATYAHASKAEYGIWGGLTLKS